MKRTRRKDFSRNAAGRRGHVRRPPEGRQDGGARTGPVRLQVLLSHSGLCSRRKAMDLIFQGRVAVNDKIVVEPSCQVHPGQDRVSLDGKPVAAGQPKEYILLNKPKGYTTTKADPFAAKTVFDLLPEAMRTLHPVGRLDKDTEGLLLLTNDGGLTYLLTHPKHLVDKAYLVKVKGNLSPTDRTRLETGIVLEGRKTAPAQVKGADFKNGETIFRMIIHEGRKRQVRRMMEQLGYPVLDLKRLSLGPLRLGGLETGRFRRLTPSEVDDLKHGAQYSGKS